MSVLTPLLKKGYWLLAGLGMIWAVFVGCLISPTTQRYALYAPGLNSNWFSDPSDPEAFGFAKGQVKTFRLDTTDGESLFCWHVLPLDVYLAHESELVFSEEDGESDGLEGTVGAKLLRGDDEAKVVVSFHGNGGHIAESERILTYRTISSIPKTHLLTCSYRGFGTSTLRNAPHIPTENGLITDATSLLSYLRTSLSHPLARTAILGQSLGTAVATAAALHLADPTSELLPANLPSAAPPHQDTLAALLLIAPFTNTVDLAETIRIAGFLPVLRPLRAYPRIASFISDRIVETWFTSSRLNALVSLPHSPLRVSILHARNDVNIDFRHSEAVFEGLSRTLLARGGNAVEERRSFSEGGEGVRRGAFAFKRVQSKEESVVVELEVLRFGGHNDVLGFSATGLAVRRAFAQP